MMRKGMSPALAAAVCGMAALVGPLRADGGPDGAYCPDGCGADGGLKAVCRPEVFTRTVNKFVYRAGHEEYCPTCSIIGMLFHTCHCSKVKTRKYLIQKVQKNDYTCKRCVLTHEPCGGAACGTASCGECQAAVVPVPAVLPPPAPPGGYPPAFRTAAPASSMPAQIPPAQAPLPAAAPAISQTSSTAYPPSAVISVTRTTPAAGPASSPSSW